MALPQEDHHQLVSQERFSQKHIDILKNSICKGATPEEFEVFLMACNKTQLDPFMRQIYAVKRYDNKLKRECFTVQTGIDGYRLIAERTGKYCPGRKPTFTYDEKGQLLAATAYVKKLTKDGTWHEIEAEAYMDEYCQFFTDKNTGEKRPMGMWANMARNQLAKCAESLALRKSFPAETSGIYTKEEMQQADIEDITPRISLEQAAHLEDLFSQCDLDYKNKAFEFLKKVYKVNSLAFLPEEIYLRVRAGVMKNIEQADAKDLANEDENSEIESEVQ